MLVLRPIADSDLAGLETLAGATGGGLTTLPPDRDFLADRIAASVRAFHSRVRKPGGEYYLFALEDTATAALLGVAGLLARVGGFDPWYAYELRPERLIHRPLKVDRAVPVLHLTEEHRGPSELCSLFLRADRRRGGAGRLLSLGRLLYVGAQPQRFTAELIAELRGSIDPTGRSPFWEAVGRHFFPFDFYAADVLSGLGEKEFIADLMPRHPLYLPLFPPEVQAAIGQVHHHSAPALALLLAEGFAATNKVDIFDAGPIVRARADTLRTLRLTRTDRVKSAGATAPADAPLRLLTNAAATDFRACLGPVLPHDDGRVSLTPECAAALNLEPGDKVSHAPLR